MKQIKEILKFISFPFLFGIGLFTFLFTRKTYNLVYVSFRYLFVLTNGRVNDFYSRLIVLFYKQKKKNAKGILGDLSENDIEKIVKSIELNGYYEFETKLDEDTLNTLHDFAKTTPTRCIDVNKKGVVYFKDKVTFDEDKPISPRYQFDTADVIQNKTVRKIIFDNTFQTIAANYLACNPILDIVTMWWSVPFQNKGTSQAAQMYHFDMDRFKFLKFFFYLSDVHTDNGPHCYIQGSHKGIHFNVRKDRRMEDKELENYYSTSKFKEFTGAKGTILAVDTRGLHKGKPLVMDNRLLFQIQFSNSLFGAPYESMKILDPSEKETEIMTTSSRTYQLMN
jgi:hypothetical protein